MEISTGRRDALILLTRTIAALSTFALFDWACAKKNAPSQEAKMKLPPPRTEGSVSIERAIQNRRTVRSYEARKLDTDQLSQLLWAAQGMTEDGGFKRAAPSAGALYPMDVYAVLGQDGVKGFEPGVYHYRPGSHSVERVSPGDLRKTIARAALSQMWIAEAPVVLVITAEYSRITGKYGERGVQYAMIEAGHIGQNIFLQAEGLGLAAGIVGAFHEKRLIEAMDIPQTHEPLLIMPVGYGG
jgi:SagB-type dehydrogenase family enzyme